MKQKAAAPHPGDTLREDFLKPLGMTPNALALALHVPASRIGEIVHGRRAITAETAMRLARYFGGAPSYWLHLQARYDEQVARNAYAREIEREVRPRKTAV